MEATCEKIGEITGCLYHPASADEITEFNRRVKTLEDRMRSSGEL